ncbi:hypothetical protein GWK47_027572 [Chionoecetes opilio]|uniref:RNase H type-1 domain-containing protein n=1 Tax=Chionoecetes opilio TaxID=41210 RepID=A0A8J8WDZ9_CHIOP|nr:hypothetical protein GWK47_027572 [Chionoecetes opilio]
MGILQGIERTGRSVTFIWVPSHVGITLNERVDDIAKQATCRDSVDIQGTFVLRQVKTQIRDTQNDTDKTRMENKICQPSVSWHTIKFARADTLLIRQTRKLNGKTQSSRDLGWGPLLRGTGDERARGRQKMVDYASNSGPTHLQHYILAVSIFGNFQTSRYRYVTTKLSG